MILLLEGRNLEGGTSGLNMKTMAKKQSTKTPGKTGRTSGSRIAGTTSDGVVVLRTKAKPTHFTAQQIRETIHKTGLALNSKSTAKR
jgi:hypothetical protein